MFIPTWLLIVIAVPAVLLVVFVVAFISAFCRPLH